MVNTSPPARRLYSRTSHASTATDVVGIPYITVHRDDRIRTCDILLPKQARYQAALHPVRTHCRLKLPLSKGYFRDSLGGGDFFEGFLSLLDFNLGIAIGGGLGGDGL